MPAGTKQAAREAVGISMSCIPWPFWALASATACTLAPPLLTSRFSWCRALRTVVSPARPHRVGDQRCAEHAPGTRGFVGRGGFGPCRPPGLPLPAPFPLTERRHNSTGDLLPSARREGAKRRTAPFGPAPFRALRQPRKRSGGGWRLKRC